MLIYQRVTDTPYFLVASNCHNCGFPQVLVSRIPEFIKHHLSVFICPYRSGIDQQEAPQYCQYANRSIINVALSIINHHQSSFINTYIPIVVVFPIVLQILLRIPSYSLRILQLLICPQDLVFPFRCIIVVFLVFPHTHNII